MKTYILLLTLFIIPSLLSAKIIPPTPVKPIVHNNVEYSAPHEHMGCIYARDIKTKEVIWWRQVYAIKFAPGLERDVQWVFITSIKMEGNNIIVTNGDNNVYKLDIDSLEVVTIGIFENLVGTWEHVQGNTYFRKGTKKLPPSRFREKYIFRQDGSCEWLSLAANDAHSMQSGTWKIHSASQQVIRIFDEESNLVKSLKIEVIDTNELLLKDVVLAVPVQDLSSKEAIMEFVDAWLQAKKLNAYGDELDRMYMGATPLFNEATGQSTDRLVYLLKRLPELEIAIREKFTVK